MKKLILYGAGDMFLRCFNKYIYERLKERYAIVGVVDKSAVLKDNILIPQYKTVPLIKDAFICITSVKYYDEIKYELMMLGIDSNKILDKSFWFDFYCRQYLLLDILSGRGIEIGGPSDVFKQIYQKELTCDGVNFSKNTVWGNNLHETYKWGETNLGRQFIADGTDLSIIADETYDFLLSSNNLEHIANPLKALKEFYRILKPGGFMYILVPDKKYTFDHLRDYTTFEHILEDYKENTQEDDLTHMQEIVEKHDLEMDNLAGAQEQFKERCLKNYENRCMHHHVFNSELLKKIAWYLEMKIIKNCEFNRNYFLIAQK